MSTDEPVTGEPDDPGAARDAQLMARLKRLVTDEGVVGAAEALGVNYRTLSSCLENGRLSRRVREAVRKLPDADAREPSPPATETQAAVEQRVEALEQAVGEMAGAQADIRARLARLEAAVGNRSAQQPMAESGEAGTTAGAGDDAEQHSQHPTAESGSDDGWTPPKRAHGMPRPGVVTLEVQDDEAVAFGPAAALVDEWRELRSRGTGSGSGVDRARAQERRWELEVAMIGDFGLTLPPEKEPLDDERRHDHLRWRTKALQRTRHIRTRRERLRALRRFLTLGLWWD